MPEYTQEELDKLIAEKVARAQNARDVANYGHTGFVMSIEYLQDQAKRGIIPVQIVQVMQMIHQTFLNDTAYGAQTSPASEQKPE